jgi:hypothetical protein
VPPRPSTSLRSSFAWTLAGNGLYAAGQWAILSLIAKLGGREMLGQYALAVALITPLVMLSHLNLRAVLATDVAGRRPFGDYLAVRLGVSALSLVGIAILALVSGRSGPLAAVILVTGLAQSSETVSDIYYGAMQRRDRMELIARSMMARAVVSVGAFGLALYLLHDLVWALAALAAGRLVLLLAYDRPMGAAGENLARSSPGAEVSILRTAVPLGVMLLLVSLNTNLPRYAIERFLGVGELGAFAAVGAALQPAGARALSPADLAPVGLCRRARRGRHSGGRRLWTDHPRHTLPPGVRGARGPADRRDGYGHPGLRGDRARVCHHGGARLRRAGAVVLRGGCQLRRGQLVAGTPVRIAWRGLVPGGGRVSADWR